MAAYRERPERARRAIVADVGLGVGECVMLAALPLGLLVPMLGVPALYLRDALRRGVPEAWELAAFVGGPLAVAAILALLLAWVVRGFDLRQRVYEDGYERTYRGKTRFVPFEEVRALADDSTWAGSGRPRITLPSFELALDGERISLWRDGSFSRWHESVPRAARVYEAMARAYGAYRGPLDVEAIRGGEARAYGRVAVTLDAITIDGERVACARVSRIARELDVASRWLIAITIDGARRTIPAHEVPDHPALVHVVGALTARRP